MNHQLEHVKSKIKKLKKELTNRFFIKSIGLFGSITRDDFTDKSDIDILVDFTRPIGIEFVDLAEFLEKNLNRKVDLVSKNALKTLFYDAIKDEIQYV